MKAAIHQSHYLPWLSYWHKAASADVFVVLDDVQYTKNDWQNRNKIKGPGGPLLLTVPVFHRIGRTIAETEIDAARGWARKHREAVRLSYAKAPFFERYFPALDGLYARGWRRLGEVNEAFFSWAAGALGLRTRVVKSSDLGVGGVANERLIAICGAVGSDVYLSGRRAAETYLKPEAFAAAGVGLEIQHWSCPVYPQGHPAAGFVPDLSIVDLLMNAGDRSLDVLKGGG